jgi:hypothetical protein
LTTLLVDLSRKLGSVELESNIVPPDKIAPI